jgi:hypothetical protein
LSLEVAGSKISRRRARSTLKYWKHLVSPGNCSYFPFSILVAKETEQRVRVCRLPRQERHLGVVKGGTPPASLPEALPAPRKSGSVEVSGEDSSLVPLPSAWLPFTPQEVSTASHRRRTSCVVVAPCSHDQLIHAGQSRRRAALFWACENPIIDAPLLHHRGADTEAASFAVAIKTPILDRSFTGLPTP